MGCDAGRACIHDHVWPFLKSEEIEVPGTVTAGPGIDVPTALYRLFNAATVLIYVGISDSLKVRMRNHADTKPWWPEVASKTIEWYPTWGEAKDAETAAIAEERPLYNLAEVAAEMRVKWPSAVPEIPAWSDASCRAIIGQISAILTDSTVSHAQARLRCTNLLLAGKDLLPRGAELRVLAAQCGVSLSGAYKSTRPERVA
jgi:hypothetical protein